jgi:uncharacterized OsmC-like protein
MDTDQLRARQAPIKKLFRESPDRALQTLEASGILNPDSVTCEVQTFLGSTPAGLHTYTGGDGSAACSAEMLLEALVGCAGVTLSVVARALDIPLEKAVVRAEGRLDFRGTLGVDRSVPVGFENIQLVFEIATPASDEQLAKLLELTERYCVVHQSLRETCPPRLERITV